MPENEIEVNQGIVILMGYVSSRRFIKAAEECIEDIIGIKDVFNLIILNEICEKGPVGLIKSQARIDE